MASVYAISSKNQQRTFLLITIFIGLTAGVFYLFGAAYNNYWIAFIGLFLSIFQTFIAYFVGDAMALGAVRAVETSPQSHPEIHLLVENISKIAGIPKPKVYISPDRSANAFACGRNPENASICINQGLLELLNKPELEGVIAHEIAHIKNRDILVMTVVASLTGIIAFLTDIGFRLFGFFNNDDENPVNPLIFLLFLVSIILAPIVSILIQMSVSRSREYNADATAIIFTRYPEGLISALKKLYSQKKPADFYSSSMNHFFISPPKKKYGEKINELFSTHPNIENRIKNLSGQTNF